MWSGYLCPPAQNSCQCSQSPRWCYPPPFRGGSVLTCHTTTWTSTLQNSWCLHHVAWWWGYDGIHYQLSIKDQTPWGRALSTPLQMCHATLAPQLSLPLLHRALKRNQASMAQLQLRLLRAQPLSNAQKNIVAYITVKSFCAKTQILLLSVWALRTKVVKWAGIIPSFCWRDLSFICIYM